MGAIGTQICELSSISTFAKEKVKINQSILKLLHVLSVVYALAQIDAQAIAYVCCCLGCCLGCGLSRCSHRVGGFLVMLILGLLRHCLNVFSEMQASRSIYITTIANSSHWSNHTLRHGMVYCHWAFLTTLSTRMSEFHSIYHLLFIRLIQFSLI